MGSGSRGQITLIERTYFTTLQCFSNDANRITQETCEHRVTSEQESNLLRRYPYGAQGFDCVHHGVNINSSGLRLDPLGFCLDALDDGRAFVILQLSRVKDVDHLLQRASGVDSDYARRLKADLRYT